MSSNQRETFTEVWKESVAGRENQIWENICDIGGERGWYFGTALWKIRGLIDRVFGGVGYRKGRPIGNLEVGDQVDFWRVIHVDNSKKTLKMEAEMKLPGSVWITFEIIGSQFIQKVEFQPSGNYGRVYWFMVKPIHYLMFNGMFRAIIKYKR
ncbi:DUF2867 domain-containing protein [Belliella baltica]|uniref:DUF2867 domain-containing protein n=1 Tax=Belliella baltica TaxID=232259 RepID=UPI0002DC496D|nr:DUF2867 domain-containing protein [Belliella baltica]